MKKLIFFVIIAILIFAIYGGIDLSLLDYREKDVCPKLLGIPACYLVLVFFSLTFIFHVFKKHARPNFGYFIFLSFPFLLALSGTISEMSGKVICPRTPGGTPMCYISLGICTALLVLKIVEQRMTNRALS